MNLNAGNSLLLNTYENGTKTLPLPKSLYIDNLKISTNYNFDYLFHN